MSLLSGIKSVANKVGSAVKNYASNVVGGAKIVGKAVSSTFNNAVKAVGASNLTTGYKAPVLQARVGEGMTPQQTSKAYDIIKSPSGNYKAPVVTGQRAGVTYYGDEGAKELARVESIMSPTANRLVSSSTPSSYNAGDISASGGAFETPMYFASPSQDISNYLGQSSMNSGSTIYNNMGSITGAGTIGATDTGATAYDEELRKKEKETANNEQDLIDMMNELAGKSKTAVKLEEQAGLPAMTSELKDLQAKQSLQTAEYMAQIQNIQNKPIAMEFIAGQQGEVNRRYGIDAMITSALIQGKQGQIETAQATVDRALSLKYDPILARIDTQKAILEMNYKSLDRADQKIADERNAELDAEKADLTQFKSIQTETLKNAIASGSDSATVQAIANASSFEELASAGGGQYAPSGTFADFGSFTATLTPSQQTSFANIPDDLKSSVQQLVSGDALISDLVKSRGIQGTKNIQQLINYAQSVDPTYSINTEKQRYAFKQKFVNDQVPGSVGSRNAINTALGHLADLTEYSKELPAGTLKKMNSVKNVLSKEFGDPAVTNFRIALEALGSELARVYKGGVPNEGEIRAWQEALASNFSKSQLNGAFNTTAKLLSSKITAVRYLYKSTMGKEFDQSLIDPDKRQALIDAGINPDAIIKESLPVAVAGVISPVGTDGVW